MVVTSARTRSVSGPPSARVADLVVVGGGALGIAAALHARRSRPDWRVALLDQAAPGAGATGRSLAVVAPTGENAAIRSLVARSIELYRSTGLRAVVRRRAALVVVPEQAEPLLRQQTTSPVRRARTSDLQGLHACFPDLHVRSGEAVFAVDEDFLQVDTQALADLPAAAGVAVACGARVDACREADGRWELLTAEEVRWHSPRLVFAVGPWQPPLITTADGVWNPPRARVKRVAALHVTGHIGRPNDPLVAFPADNLLLVPGGDGLRVSFLNPYWRSQPIPAGPVEAPAFTADDLAAGRDALALRAPRLAEQADGGQVFWDSYPVDSPSSIGPASLSWLNGGAGRGVRLAPALAETALARLAGTDALPVRPCPRPNRSAS
ncbi:FAD-dependent oxidoreductase [Embleya sp. NPDC005575]|uniref:FAD-dependent oxidoreductase n=1 Tax=Embleya sp. NPDC005575 TaxID=3156892 RepID=UPI0033B1D9CC